MFLDTSGLLCYLHRDELGHPEAVACFDSVEGKLTRNYVLAEFVAWANARRLPRAAALAFTSDLLGHPDVEVIWVTHLLHHDAMRLLMAQPDKSYSLCDAVSFLVMRERHTVDVFTTDRHFTQAGFRAMLG